MERLDQNIHAALVGRSLSNIDHPDSPAGIAVNVQSLADRSESGGHPTCSVVSHRNP
jgi:hypothetical protein